MKLTKPRVAILIVTLLAASGSYLVGRSGYDVGRAIVESRCSAGAFIEHSESQEKHKHDGTDRETEALNPSPTATPVYTPTPQAVAPVMSEAMVSLTFDDGWRSVYSNALPIMDRYNMVSTQYIISGYLGSSKFYMTPKHVYKFRERGHEIASHTIDHSDLTTLSDKELRRQLLLSRDGLTKCFEPAISFAAPYGANNARTIAAQKSLYQTSRSVETGYNTPDTLDPYHLKVQNIYANTKPEEVREWLATAAANRSWLILVYHQIDDSGSEFSRRPADFETDLASVKASGIKVKTVSDAYASTQNRSVPK